MSDKVEINAELVLTRNGQHDHDPEDVAHQDLTDESSNLEGEKSHKFDEGEQRSNYDFKLTTSD